MDKAATLDGPLSYSMMSTRSNQGMSMGDTIGSAWSIKSTPRTAPATARGQQPVIDYEVEPPDPQTKILRDAEAQFFSSSIEKESIHSARHKYPRKKTNPDIDPLTGEEEGTIPRHIMGFGLGFERIFATTSIKLPVSAYTIFVELQTAHNGVTFSRCFNGLHTVFDLKKWVYEKLLLPMNSYDLSYAEPGKATLTDQLRLLTTQDSLDTRTLATTRAVHRMYKGIPGVHSINDVGVTRLYVRLKCRTCGELWNSLQTCRKYKSFGPMELPADQGVIVPATTPKAKNASKVLEDVGT